MVAFHYLAEATRVDSILTWEMVLEDAIAVAKMHPRDDVYISRKEQEATKEGL